MVHTDGAVDLGPVPQPDASILLERKRTDFRSGLRLLPVLLHGQLDVVRQLVESYLWLQAVRSSDSAGGIVDSTPSYGCAVCTCLCLDLI